MKSVVENYFHRLRLALPALAENDAETKTQDYGFRIYNPALGKFLSVDPLTKKYPFYSPYHYAGNSPIKNIDLDGAEPAGNKSDWKVLQTGESFVSSTIHNGKTVMTYVTQYRVEDKTGQKYWVNEANWNSSYHGLWSNTSEFKYFNEDPNKELPKMDKERWEGFETSYQFAQKGITKTANGIGTTFFGITVAIAAAPVIEILAPELANIGRVAWQGVKNEASLMKFIPKKYLPYALTFGANSGLQFAYNGKDADLWDAATSTINPWVGLFSNSVIDYKPFSGDIIPEVSSASPEIMEKKFLISAPFFLLGNTMQTLNPKGYGPTTDYLLNVAEETADETIPDNKPE